MLVVKKRDLCVALGVAVLIGSMLDGRPTVKDILQAIDQAFGKFIDAMFRLLVTMGATVLAIPAPQSSSPGKEDCAWPGSGCSDETPASTRLKLDHERNAMQVRITKIQAVAGGFAVSWYLYALLLALEWSVDNGFAERAVQKLLKVMSRIGKLFESLRNRPHRDRVLIRLSKVILHLGMSISLALFTESFGPGRDWSALLLLSLTVWGGLCDCLWVTIGTGPYRKAVTRSKWLSAFVGLLVPAWKFWLRWNGSEEKFVPVIHLVWIPLWFGWHAWLWTAWGVE